MKANGDSLLAGRIAGGIDFLVAGGGPAGISAAVTAARAGLRTVLLEQDGCLGGIWSAGLLSCILDWQGKGGFLGELVGALESRHALLSDDGWHLVYKPEMMKLILEEFAVDAGVRLRYHSRVVAAIVDPSRGIQAVETESVSGRERWDAPLFLDATGNGDLASQAGAAWRTGRDEDGRTQPFSLMSILVGIEERGAEAFVTNGTGGALAAFVRLRDEFGRAGFTPSYGSPALFRLGGGMYTLMANHVYHVSALSADDITTATIAARKEIHASIAALRSLGDPWSRVEVAATAQRIGTREGRRIEALYRVTRDDLVAGTRHADAICRVCLPVDIHSPTEREGTGFTDGGIGAKPYDIPARSLVAARIPNLLLAGRCIDGDFFAHASYRVTGNAVPTGEAAGKLAATSLYAGLPPAECLRTGLFPGAGNRSATLSRLHPASGARSPEKREPA